MNNGNTGHIGGRLVYNSDVMVVAEREGGREREKEGDGKGEGGERENRVVSGTSTKGSNILEKTFFIASVSALSIQLMITISLPVTMAIARPSGDRATLECSFNPLISPLVIRDGSCPLLYSTKTATT